MTGLPIERIDLDKFQENNQKIEGTQINSDKALWNMLKLQSKSKSLMGCSIRKEKSRILSG